MTGIGRQQAAVQQTSEHPQQHWIKRSITSKASSKNHRTARGQRTTRCCSFSIWKLQAGQLNLATEPPPPGMTA
ncbi:hypothetical protein Nepgr_031758 [Nepenthes gracilis]|uniref:Uncharacterized protein n=1 Tax=Nepenthes gracilis TaxID=150966 RepID=A0AAD3THC3_NEPGR|nr:hypothetical protein Nepgr_031758 [Nepenthes gracilis]